MRSIGLPFGGTARVIESRTRRSCPCERATMRGNIVGHRAEGDVVRANGRRGDGSRSRTNAAMRRGEKDAKRRWMLTLHPEFGRLLRRCRDDGSDITL